MSKLRWSTWARGKRVDQSHVFLRAVTVSCVLDRILVYALRRSAQAQLLEAELPQLVEQRTLAVCRSLGLDCKRSETGPRVIRITGVVDLVFVNACETAQGISAASRSLRVATRGS